MTKYKGVSNAMAIKALDETKAERAILNKSTALTLCEGHIATAFFGLVYAPDTTSMRDPVGAIEHFNEAMREVRQFFVSKHYETQA